LLKECALYLEEEFYWKKPA